MDAKVIKECGKGGNKYSEKHIYNARYIFVRHICYCKEFYVDLWDNNMNTMDFNKVTKEAVIQALQDIKKMAFLKMHTLLLMTFYIKAKDFHLNW